ncbi:hypothetical protein VOLCADRAFT_71391 [Volvox carteri f. nagariensis]|uniref:Carbonic anhydrase n=1 Tax=Volvox carteri f. nagariensis TaxID=3068 RepID=D8ULP0_VOLCA|nr:uncharacterized protein VOLCADRAFT_71391 [Volvox carteri f. nagariensis]EFJ39358.1 hypothetical protein VOLCADRAFT_71391 [Volvox carteri f. nagariensis]|eukprot:XP_002959576.1 hypothetical protein VOLCADRAFT_71391 [Volvox carteri f. nagariensis]
MLLLEWLVLAVIYFSTPAVACIFKYGTSPDSLAPPHGGSPWNHALQGDDWAGVDAAGNPWMCLTGTHQSPLNLPNPGSLNRHGDHIPDKFRTRWSYPTIYSNGSNVEVINNGHAIQIEWLSPYAADVEIVVPGVSNATRIAAVLNMKPGDNFTTVKAIPLQFHFHTVSEHLVGGKYYPLELHIVHRVTDLPACTAGCFSVTGVLFELTQSEDNPFLEAIWAAMPMREGAINYLPPDAEVRLEELLPPPSSREYVTYEGSLTTPPCSEGLLWHVMLKPQKISMAQWTKYKTAVGYKECSPKNATTSATNATNTRYNSRHLHRAQHRRLLTVGATAVTAEEASSEGTNPDDYVCKVVAYGTNFRAPQHANNRTIKLAQVP